jgi:hypothetical protein
VADYTVISDPTILRRTLCHYRNRLDQSSSVDSDFSETSTDPVEFNQVYFAWARFRISYSLSALTREEDKLVALLGVANDFGLAVGDTLVAGLWRNRLLEDLCWQGHVSDPKTMFDSETFAYPVTDVLVLRWQ